MNGSDFTAQIEYAAARSAVYRALITPDGLRGWWGTHATVGTTPGELEHLLLAVRAGQKPVAPRIQMAPSISSAIRDERA